MESCVPVKFGNRHSLDAGVVLGYKPGGAVPLEPVQMEMGRGQGGV
jgi:hypothetical protein